MNKTGLTNVWVALVDDWKYGWLYTNMTFFVSNLGENEHHHTIKKIKKGSFKNDVMHIWRFSDPLLSCHAKTGFFLHLYTQCHKSEYPLVTWRHLWTLPKLYLQLRECLERHCFPEACWQSGCVLVGLPDAMECSQAHSEKRGVRMNRRKTSKWLYHIQNSEIFPS